MNLKSTDISNFIKKGYVVYKMMYERYGDHGDFPILKKWWSRFSDVNDELIMTNMMYDSDDGPSKALGLFKCACFEVRCAINCSEDSVFSADIDRKLMELQAYFK